MVVVAVVLPWDAFFLSFYLCQDRDLVGIEVLANRKLLTSWKKIRCTRRFKKECKVIYNEERILQSQIQRQWLKKLRQNCRLLPSRRAERQDDGWKKVVSSE